MTDRQDVAHAPAIAGNPFSQADGHWVRCALHAHTTNSDGELPPDALVAHYERLHFDVLAITDHWFRTEAASTGRLLVIPSAELSAPLGSGDSFFDVLAYGIDELPPDLSPPSFPEMDSAAAWITAHGGVPFLAHPHWSGVDPQAVSECSELVGIEIFNGLCEFWYGSGLSTVHWDRIIDSGRRCFGIAGDDLHYPGFDSARAWTWLRVRERSKAAVLEALATGMGYASTGPVLLDVHRDGEAVEVRCSPCQSVALRASAQNGARVNAGRLGTTYGGEILEEAHDGAITAARLQCLEPGANFLRVEVIDAAGRTAWTNAL